MAQAALQPPLAQQTYPWLMERANNALIASHFESSIYGPLNSILHGIFPTQQMFMIKPQGILRKEADGNIDSNHATYDMSYDSEGNNSAGSNILTDFRGLAAEVALALNRVENNGVVAPVPNDGDLFIPNNISAELPNFSMDSYLCWVPPRRADTKSQAQDSAPESRKGQDKTVVYPDFIAVKATAALDRDTLISVIEVKKNTDSIDRGGAQLARYLEFIAPKPNRAQHLRGFLVAGPITWTYELGPGPFAEPLFLKESRTDTGEVWEDLHEIARQYWA